MRYKVLLIIINILSYASEFFDKLSDMMFTCQLKISKHMPEYKDFEAEWITTIRENYKGERIDE